MIDNCPQATQDKVKEYLFERFGISADIFDNFALNDGGKGRVYLGPKAIMPSHKSICAGITIARISSAIKPSTIFFQLFNKNITKNIVRLDREKIVKFVKGEDLEVTETETNQSSEGYVLVSYSDFGIGCGFLKDNQLKNLLPKSKRMGLDFY
ncbi:hypothetical protein HZC07_06160 [Candidatus Micrarchaeota archaeon]|nr:hypothetical protein [Candidatus Micrarchaeota archaeon]